MLLCRRSSIGSGGLCIFERSFSATACSKCGVLFVNISLISESILGGRKQQDLSAHDGTKQIIYRVDVDVPADDWANIADFYDVVVFNTGHWWGYDKVPKETPLVFFKDGQPLHPSLEMLDGLKMVLVNMVANIEKLFPKKVLKFWRLQSPRHFHGGDWNQNGSCLFNEPLEESQLDLWFDPVNNGVNKEAKKISRIIEETVEVQLPKSWT